MMILSGLIPSNCKLSLQLGSPYASPLKLGELVELTINSVVVAFTDKETKARILKRIKAFVTSIIDEKFSLNSNSHLPTALKDSYTSDAIL
ncbi:hypothetical protein [Candidatus Chlamydia corallus]|uniref:hypothetical protein n=1 Tax=Candidatus Chlamydia corallus TaxID=2038470 RepID=UPI00125F49C4|nr:hypothetical protein [Candidatus Chlamydia corallus]